MSDIDITGIDKAQLLASLYNRTAPVGMGFLAATPGEMSSDEAASIIARMRRQDGSVRFDYVKGRPLKVAFNGDALERADLYDRDAGEGAALSVVEALRTGGQAPISEENLAEKLDSTIANAKPSGALRNEGDYLVTTLGIGDEPALSALRAAREKFL